MCKNLVFGGMGYGSGGYAPCGGFWGLCDKCKEAQEQARKISCQEAVSAIAKKYNCSKDAAIIILEKGL